MEVMVNEPIGMISPGIYGHFTEHLGGTIYDGVWVGTKSKIANTNGIRSALVEKLRQIKAPAIRWPAAALPIAMIGAMALARGTNVLRVPISGPMILRRSRFPAVVCSRMKTMLLARMSSFSSANSADRTRILRRTCAVCLHFSSISGWNTATHPLGVRRLPSNALRRVLLHPMVCSTGA